MLLALIGQSLDYSLLQFVAEEWLWLASLLASGFALFGAWTTPRTWVAGEIVTAAIGNLHWRDQFNILKTAIDDTGDLRFVDATELTIASDAITVTQNFHKVDTQADAATDDLATITAGTSVAAGFILVLRLENTARTVVVKDGTGNILLNGGDLILNAADKLCVLIYDGTNWRGGTLQSQGDGLRESFRELHLRTSPNADVAATTVSLIRAKEIITDTGHRYTDVTNLSAVISSAGAGGLDTGAEAASTWYEVYFIVKSSDGTKNLLLHRAKDYFVDMSQTSDDASSLLRQATGTANQKIGNTITPVTTGLLERIDVKLNKANSPTGRVWISIYATSGGAPTGSALYTSDKLDCSLISATSQVIAFPFRNPPTLTASTVYAWAVEGDWTASDTIGINIRYNNADTYAGGAYYTYNGTSWSTFAIDCWFKAYITRNDTAVTMPSGYDQKCKIGYVYNDSGSDFNPFTAVDRAVKTLEQYSLVSAAITIATLTDATVAIPPGRVIMRAFLHNASAGINKLGGIPDGYSNNSLASQGIERADSDGTIKGAVVETYTEFQAVYASTTSGTIDVYPVSYTW